MGFNQIIWTLYRYTGTNNDVLSWVEKFDGALAVTMPKNRAQSDLPKRLAKKKIPTYVHTVNTVQEINYYMKNNKLSEIYTDFCMPNDNLACNAGQ